MPGPHQPGDVTSHVPPLATPDELQAAGAGASDESAGTKRAAVSNAMVGVKKQFYGKGPARARTYFNDHYVFVVLEDGLTRNEETLIAAGESDLVRTYRLAFQEAMTQTFVQAIEEILDRKVLAYHSQIVFNPVRSFEIFMLDRPVE